MTVKERLRGLIRKLFNRTKEYTCLECGGHELDCTDSYNLESWPTICIPLRCLDCNWRGWEIHEAVFQEMTND